MEVIGNEEKVIKVQLVNPPIQDPWRTREDYLLEQKREKIRFWVTVFSFIVSIISVASTAIVAILTIKKSLP